MNNSSIPLLKNIVLTVSSNVIKKIIQANASTGKKSEWIGITFYKKISDKELHLVDFCYMGKGPDNSMVANIDYTVYPKLNEVLSDYIFDNYETITDCYQGLIHSHIDMSTSPSNVDISELVDNNSNFNGTYLSVICNHRLEFTALLSIEELEQPSNIIYKWFGQNVTTERELKKVVNVYKVEVKLDKTEYKDITKALEVTKTIPAPANKHNSYMSNWKHGYQTAFFTKEDNCMDILDNYFELDDMDLSEKREVLNNYIAYGFSVKTFIDLLPPNHNVLKDIAIFSDTRFYKTLSSNLSSKNSKHYEL